MFFVFIALICMMLHSYRTHIILYTVFNVDCGAECLMYIVYYLLFQFCSLTGYNRKNLHLLSSSAPFSVKAQLPYKACFNVKQAAFKLSTISLSPHSAFLTSLSLFFSLPHSFFLSFLSFFILTSCFHLSFPPSFSSIPVFLPLLAPSQSATLLSDVAVNCISLTQAEFGMRGHLFIGSADCW